MFNYVFSAAMTTYHVYVYTSDKLHAGTDANVFVVLFGKLDDTGNNPISTAQNSMTCIRNMKLHLRYCPNYSRGEWRTCLKLVMQSFSIRSKQHRFLGTELFYVLSCKAKMVIVEFSPLSSLNKEKYIIYLECVHYHFILMRRCLISSWYKPNN
jgi:hypothetical protein